MQRAKKIEKCGADPQRPVGPCQAGHLARALTGPSTCRAPPTPQRSSPPPAASPRGPCGPADHAAPLTASTPPACSPVSSGAGGPRPRHLRSVSSHAEERWVSVPSWGPTPVKSSQHLPEAPPPNTTTLGQLLPGPPPALCPQHPIQAHPPLSPTARCPPLEHTLAGPGCPTGDPGCTSVNPA